MSMTCSSNVFYDEEYFDFLAENGDIDSNDEQEFDVACSFPLSYWISAVYLKKREQSRIPYAAVPFSSIPKCYGLMDMEALNEMGIETSKTAV